MSLASEIRGTLFCALVYVLCKHIHGHMWNYGCVHDCLSDHVKILHAFYSRIPPDASKSEIINLCLQLPIPLSQMISYGSTFTHRQNEAFAQRSLFTIFLGELVYVLTEWLSHSPSLHWDTWEDQAIITSSRFAFLSMHLNPFYFILDLG